MSSTIEKVKQALHLDKDKSTSTTHNTGTAEGVHGPHSSRAANAADPRVDSDLDGSRNAGAHTHNNTHTGGSDHHYGRDAAVGAGVVGVGEHEHHKHEAHTGHSSGVTGSRQQGTTGNTTTAGPHSSNLANKLDPRVDSDRSNQYGTTGTGVGSTGAYNSGTSNTNTFGNTGNTGGISNSTNAGPHDSNLMNKADPRVDSDLSGRGNNHGTTGGMMSGSHATPGSGTAQNTAGPHNSDLMNKLDPRVDADLDGSKTVGGNRTNY